MGNSSSSRLSITITAPEYSSATSGYHIAGTRIYGSVYGESSSSLSPETTLIVYFTGKEYVRVRYNETEYYNDDGSDNRQSRPVTKYHYAKRELVRMDIPLRTSSSSSSSDDAVAESLAPGKYEYPFQIDLPFDLPGSMHANGDGGYCVITYKIKAELTNSGILSNHHHTEYELPVLAAPIPVGPPIPYLLQPYTEHFNECCCFGAGTRTIGATVENTRIGRGEGISIDFGVQSGSSGAEIQFVEATIEEYTRWWAGGRSNRSRRVLVKTFFPKTTDPMMEKQHTNEASEANNRYNKYYRKATASARDRQQAIYQEIYDRIKRGENRQTLLVPTHAMNTYHGQCCRVEHQLRIRIQTQAMVDNPEILVPVNIGTPSSLSATLATMATAFIAANDSNTEEPELDLPPANATRLSDTPHNNFVHPKYVLPPLHDPAAATDSVTNNNNNDPPFVPATPVPSTPPADWDSGGGPPAIIATTVCVSAPVELGGTCTVVESRQEILDDDDNEDTATLTTQHTTTSATAINNTNKCDEMESPKVPTFEHSLREIEHSINPITKVKNRIQETAWRKYIFSELTPSEFATIVKKVQVEVDQPTMAATLAQVKGNNFTCAYVVAVLPVIAEWLRIPMIQTLVPYCVDLQKENYIILQELDDWERICTFDDFASGTFA